MWPKSQLGELTQKGMLRAYFHSQKEPHPLAPKGSCDAGYPILFTDKGRATRIETLLHLRHTPG